MGLKFAEQRQPLRQRLNQALGCACYAWNLQPERVGLSEKHVERYHICLIILTLMSIAAKPQCYFSQIPLFRESKLPGPMGPKPHKKGTEENKLRGPVLQPRTRGSSKFRGLSWHRGVGKWTAQLRINGQVLIKAGSKQEAVLIAQNYKNYSNEPPFASPDASTAAKISIPA